MENNLNMGREFGWDDYIENDKDFVLPECDCDFEVKSFERGRHNGSDKVPPCPKAILKIEVVNAQGQSTTITHNLLLHSKCEGLICAFFTGIGQRRYGERMKMNWNTVVGSRGRCKIGVHNWKDKNGNAQQSNEIKKFYEPQQAQSAPQGGYAQTGYSAQQTQQTAFGGGFTQGRF